MTVTLGWFALVLAITRLFWMFRRGRNPGGKQVVVDGEAIEIHINRGKHRAIHGVSASFELPIRLSFTFWREGFIDRLAKGLGIARELQTHDLPFDGRVYIESEDPALHRALTRGKDLRTQLFSLLQSTSAHEVGAAGGRLWLRSAAYGNRRDLSDDVLRPMIAQDFLPAVRELRPRLSAVGGTDDARDSTRGIRRAFDVAIVTCVALGVVGLLTWGMHDDHQIALATIQQLALVTTAAMFVGLVASLFVALGATAYTHRILFDLVIAALPGIWLAAAGVFLYVNQVFDPSEARRVTVHIANTYVTEHKRRQHYHLEVRAWPDARAPRDREVSRHEYPLMESRRCVDVLWREGRFGDGWIEGFRESGSDCQEDVEK